MALPRRCTSFYGWRPDTPDIRDRPFRPKVVHVPRKVDLRPDMPKVYDQGSLGSCSGNAIAAAIQYERRKGKQPDFVPSRLFIYYNERAIEGTVKEDAGAEIRDGIKAVHKLGACPETLWPYDIKKFAQKPLRAAYREAKSDLVSEYLRVPQTLSDLKACLASGYPIVFGFTVYEGFEGDAIAKTGKQPMPKKGEKALGGHAVLAVGYDDAPSARS